jgi:hypothetical protein
MRRLTHRLGSAGQNGIRLAQQYLLRSLHNGLETRSAEAIDGYSRRFDGQACTKPYMTGQIDGVCGGLKDVPKDHVADLAPIHATAVDRGPGGCRAELRG